MSPNPNAGGGRPLLVVLSFCTPIFHEAVKFLHGLADKNNDGALKRRKESNKCRLFV